MTPQQIRLVQESFAEIVPRADDTAALFYERIFTLDPSLRPLFRRDLRSQGKKLMATLSLVVKALEQPEQIVMAVRHLGMRHVGYGVQAPDYQTMRAALLWTLSQTLCEGFTDELEAAWAAAFALLTDLMLQPPLPWNRREDCNNLGSHKDEHHA